MPSPDPARARRLLTVGLEPAGGTFAGYQLEGCIGRGATSDVHRARRDGAVVALKIMRDADAATDEELRRFREGAALGAALDHPHIVRVLEVGEHEGTPYLAMTLIEGRSLREAPPPPERAAPLMIAIARAVHHAHERGVLHRDLKPANILIDRQGQPHVADFGLARRVGQPATEGVVGTLAYLAPERLRSDPGPSSPAADVYALGVILYQLLTGELPFGEDRAGDPPPPRARTAGGGRSLEIACLCCLERNPARRYRSAADLAADLERAVRGEPIVARPPSLVRRAARWARRHPRGLALVGAALSLVLLAAVLGLGLWRARLREEARVLDTNAFMASAQAGAVLFQLRAYADRVEGIARHPAVVSLLAEGRVVNPAPYPLAALAAGFDSLSVMTIEGRVLADWPSPRALVYQRRYDFRDYFRGARRLAEAHLPGVYVSRAYRSEARDLLEFAFSAPVMGPDGEQLGVVVAPLNVKGVLGAVPMQAERAGGRITTALLGPRDQERGAALEAPPLADFTFVVHPGLARGAEWALAAPSPFRLRDAFGAPAAPGEQFSLRYRPPLEVADFRDPIPGFEGPWLAAFAPVGRTGFVVLVETPREPLLRWLSEKTAAP